MVFDSFTKSLKGITTAVSETVSDGLDTIVSPLENLTDRINPFSKGIDSWSQFEQQAYHDEYVSMFGSYLKALTTQLEKIKLAQTKRETVLKTHQWLLEQGDKTNRSTRSKTLIQALKTYRKGIAKGTIMTVDEKTQTLIEVKRLAIPKSQQSAMITNYEEFLMDAQQGVKDVTTSHLLPSSKLSFSSLQKPSETLENTYAGLNTLSFAIISDHAKLKAISTSIIKNARQIEATQDLQSSAFDGEASKYATTIKKQQKLLATEVKTQWMPQSAVVAGQYERIQKDLEVMTAQIHTIQSSRSEWKSGRITTSKKMHTTLTSALTIQTKKQKLLTKKSKTLTKRFEDHIGSVTKMSQASEKTVQAVWSKRYEQHENHLVSMHDVYLTLGSSYHWQCHLVSGLQHNLLDHRDQAKNVAYDVEPIYRALQSQSQLTHSLLQKLTRQLRKVHADLETYTSLSPAIKQTTKTLQAHITHSEKLETQLKSLERDTSKYINQLDAQHTDLKHYKKAIGLWSQTATSTMHIHCLTYAHDALESIDTHLKTSKKKLASISDNKKMNLPQTENYKHVRESMETATEAIDVYREKLSDELDLLKKMKDTELKKNKKLVAKKGSTVTKPETPVLAPVSV